MRISRKTRTGAIANRFEQAAGGDIGLVHAVLDPACAARRRVTLERGGEQPPDPAPVRSGMHIPLGAPELASVAGGAVADDAVAVANDMRVPFEVEARPLVQEILLRERRRGLRVERRLEGGDDLGHRGRIRSDGWEDGQVLHGVAHYGTAYTAQRVPSRD